MMGIYASCVDSMPLSNLTYRPLPVRANFSLLGESRIVAGAMTQVRNIVFPISGYTWVVYTLQERA